MLSSEELSCLPYKNQNKSLTLSFWEEKFKFAVVEDSMLAHCFLLGLDFMGNFDIGIDYRTSSCKQSFKIICPCISSGQVDLQHSVMIVKATEKVSHVLKIDLPALSWCSHHYSWFHNYS